MIGFIWSHFNNSVLCSVCVVTMVVIVCASVVSVTLSESLASVIGAFPAPDLQNILRFIVRLS